MRITFLPPPMEGTLSLGIYDKKGRLVRVIAREATEKDFIIGLNGLITYWDGKDDAGKNMPPGIYYARGYSVGAIDVEGVGYHGNDWITEDDSPHIRRILGETAFDPATARVSFAVELANGRRGNLNLDPAQTAPLKLTFEETSPSSTPESVAQAGADADREGLPHNFTWFESDGHAFAFGDGQLRQRLAPKKWDPANFSDLHKVVFARPSPDGVWVIDELDRQREVKQYSFAGEFLRRLKIEPAEPQPRELIGSADLLYLFEENDREQRVRVLSRQKVEPNPGDQAVSLWKTVASKTIHFSDTYDQARDILHLPDGKPFKPDSEFVVNLIDNPLLKHEPTTAHVSIGFNQNGSFIQTTDGLPLRRVTETPGLKWAVIGREGSGKQLTIFQSDGAVIEEFKARRLAVMMAFDAGDYEWTGK
jgi:hypothetical protein